MNSLSLSLKLTHTFTHTHTNLILSHIQSFFTHSLTHTNRHGRSWPLPSTKWKRINRKQIARWQHLSRLKASAFLFEIFLLGVKKNNLYLRLVMPSSGWYSPIERNIQIHTLKHTGDIHTFHKHPSPTPHFSNVQTISTHFLYATF
jgi:hypothetical protein